MHKSCTRPILYELRLIANASRKQGKKIVTTPEENLSLKIVGDYYYPRYNDGNVIVTELVEGDIKEHIGEEMVIRTIDGSFYVRTLLRGSKDDRYNLAHFSEPTMRNVEISAVYDIAAVILCEWEEFAERNPRFSKIIDLVEPSRMRLAS